ncbi:MAG TPA: hypothetical protein PLB70_05195, partial [Paludibacteraceae bacterium]|nr:hypothetical protein [Paludibacteraceae bacterium]
MSKFSIFITTFFLFWILFLPTYEFIPDYTINGWVKNSMVLFMVLYFRNDIVPSFKGEYKGLFWALAGYGLISVLSVFINADTISQYPAYIWSDGKQIEMESNATVKNAFYNFIYLLTFALFMRKLSMEHKIVQFIKILFYLMLGLTIWVDIDAFSRAVIDDEDIFGYVVENKFIVCYTNLFLCVLFHL